MATVTSAELDQNGQLRSAKPIRPQHHYPRCSVGGFSHYDGAKVKVSAMRWDAVHGEFQYLVKTTFTDPGHWVSERSIAK